MRQPAIPPPFPVFASTEGTSSNSESGSGGPEFIPFLLTLSPHEAYVVGVILAFILSLELKPAEQELIGLFFELVGFNLGYIAAHALTQEEKRAECEAREVEKERELMKQEIEELKVQVETLQQLVFSQVSEE